MSILAHLGVTSALVALAKTESKNMKELIARVLNAICKHQVSQLAKTESKNMKELIARILNAICKHQFSQLAKTESNNMKELIARILNAICKHQVSQAVRDLVQEYEGAHFTGSERHLQTLG